MNGYYQFISPVIFLVSGRDSKRYLQARLSNDITNLNILDSVNAGCLSPQGKTESILKVTKLDDNKYLLVCLSGKSDQVISTLKKFLVADRVDITDLTQDYNLYYFNFHNLDFLSSNLPCTKDQNFFIFHNDYNTNGCLAVLKKYPEVALEDQTLGINRLNENDFSLLRIKAKMPEFNFEIIEDSLFVEALRFDCISNTKGCYAGQEVVERTLALGKPPFNILSFYIDYRLNISTNCNILIGGSGDVVGKVLNSAYSDNEKRTYLFTKIKYKFKSLELNISVAEKKYYLVPF